MWTVNSMLFRATEAQSNTQTASTPMSPALPSFWSMMYTYTCIHLHTTGNILSNTEVYQDFAKQFLFIWKMMYSCIYFIYCNVICKLCLVSKHLSELREKIYLVAWMFCKIREHIFSFFVYKINNSHLNFTLLLLLCYSFNHFAYVRRKENKGRLLMFDWCGRLY